jgi:hypothetical protein
VERKSAEIVGHRTGGERSLWRVCRLFPANGPDEMAGHVAECDRPAMDANIASKAT